MEHNNSEWVNINLTSRDDKEKLKELENKVEMLQNDLKIMIEMQCKIMEKVNKVSEMCEQIIQNNNDNKSKKFLLPSSSCNFLFKKILC